MRHTSLVLLLVLFSAAAFAQSVTVADAMSKIHPSDGASSITTAEIHAAQNEFESFQLIVRGPASGVSATMGTLTGPGGATIPSSEIRLFREAYLNITTASNTEGGTGMWPDALVPDVDDMFNEKRNAFPFDVPSGQNRVIWVEVHVPQGQTPGTYTGSINVSGTGISASVPVTLLVWNFSLPSTSNLASTFGMSWDGACVAHFGSYDACGGDAGVERMHLLYARFMLNHRLTADVVYTGPTSCTGSSCDWTHFDSTYGALFDGTDSSLRLPGAKQTTIRFIWTGTSDHYTAWAQHFRAKGWFDRTYDYTCDEPPATCAWTDIPNRAAIVHGADPQFRTLVTTTINEANTNGVTSSINILSPVVNFMDDKAGNSQFTGNQRSNYNSYLSSNSNNKLFWYQSCMSHSCGGVGGDYFSGWPSVMVDDSSSQTRAQGMLSWMYGVSGMLYYETLLHLDTAWSTVYDSSFGGNGDGTLLYPGKPSIIGGTDDIPVASIRLKMLREGLEDYEYMKLVSDLGDPGFAQSTGQALYPNVYSSNQPSSSIYNAREQLAQRILQLNGGGTSTTVNMTAPANGSTVSGTITLSATASDPGGIAGVTFLVDGVATGSEITTAPYNASFNTTTLANGTHTFAARARNTANATTTSGAVSVTVSNGGGGSGQLTVTSALALTPASPAVNQSTTATFTVKNTGTGSFSVQYFLVGARDPSNGNVDFPASAAVTLQAGQSYTYSASRSFSTTGAYSAWPSYFDGTNWIQLATPSNFTVQTTSPGQLTVTTALALSPASPGINQSTTATFTVQNTGGSPFSVQYFLVGARDPSNGNVDFPASAAVTLQPGQSYSYSGSRTFATSGTFTAWPSYYDGTNWIQLANPSNFTVQSSPPLFSDNFNRTTGLGTNWSVLYGSYSTNGTQAVSGTPQANGNWAKLNATLGTNNYSVSADMIVPAGSLDSGLVARSNDSTNVDRTLYSAQIATDGNVYLYRRNEWNWTQLASAAGGIVAGTSYNVKLLVSGSSPVHLEVWLNGVQKISFNDSSASQITSGVAGIVNYDANVKYDNYTVTTP
jgi:hypothetical protein